MTQDIGALIREARRLVGKRAAWSPAEGADARIALANLADAAEMQHRQSLARTIGQPGTGQTRPSGEPFTAAEPKEPFIDEGN